MKRNPLLLLSLAATLALLLAACSAPSERVVVTVSTGTIESDDGNKIVYDVRGSGPLTLVFVHCWAGNRTFWAGQLDDFARVCRVVSLDLPGHGESGKDRESWHIEDLGADVAKVVTKLELGKNVVLIGHSMGGPVSLAAAALLPGKVRAVIGVDTLHDLTKPMAKEAVAPLVAGFQKDFAGQMRSAITWMFGSRADSAECQWVIAQAQRTDPKVAIALFADFPALDQAALMKRCRVPVRCINAAPVGNNPKTNRDGNRGFGDFDVTYMPDVGHFLQIEAPQKFNLALAQTLVALPG